MYITRILRQPQVNGPDLMLSHKLLCGRVKQDLHGAVSCISTAQPKRERHGSSGGQIFQIDRSAGSRLGLEGYL